MNPVLVDDHGAGELTLIPFLVMVAVFVVFCDALIYPGWPQESFLFRRIVEWWKRR